MRGQRNANRKGTSGRPRVSSGDNTARIWDAVTAKEIAVLRGHNRQVFSAAFSRDGSRIVTASGDKTARIWDAANGRETTVLRGHEGPVNSDRLQPRRVARGYGVTGQDRPHLGRCERSGERCERQGDRPNGPYWFRE